MSLGVIFLSEVVGTAMLILLGCGVVANTALAKTKGNGTGFLFVNWGWGLAVFAGVLVSYKSGGHLNPAVTLGITASGAEWFIKDQIAVGAASILTYIGAQMVGAFIGAVLCWLAYKQHFDTEADAATKLGVFSTGPAIRNSGWNIVTEAIATFVLVFVVLAAGTKPQLSFDPLESVQTMTAFIVQISLGDTPQGSVQFLSLFAVAMVLFVMTFVLNLLSAWFVRRYRTVY